jgi:hypothetical protein
VGGKHLVSEELNAQQPDALPGSLDQGAPPTRAEEGGEQGDVQPAQTTPGAESAVAEPLKRIDDTLTAALGILVSSPTFRALAAFLTVAAPLLVVSGAVARWAEFYWTLGIDGQYAADYPIGGLLLTGAGVFLVPLYYWLIGFPTILAMSPIKWRTSRRVRLTLGLAVAAGMLVFFPGWPHLWLQIIPTVLVWTMAWIVIRRGHHRTIEPLIETFFLAAFLAAAVAGITGTVPGVVAVQAVVTSGAPIHSGTYILVGEDDNSVTFSTCGPNPRGTSVTLSRDYLVSLTENNAVQPRPEGGSLWSIVTGSGSPSLTQRPC